NAPEHLLFGEMARVVFKITDDNQKALSRRRRVREMDRTESVEESRGAALSARNAAQGSIQLLEIIGRMSKRPKPILEGGDEGHVTGTQDGGQEARGGFRLVLDELVRVAAAASVKEKADIAVFRCGRNQIDDLAWLLVHAKIKIFRLEIGDRRPVSRQSEKAEHARRCGRSLGG